MNRWYFSPKTSLAQKRLELVEALSDLERSCYAEHNRAADGGLTDYSVDELTAVRGCFRVLYEPATRANLADLSEVLDDTFEYLYGPEPYTTQADHLRYECLRLRCAEMHAIRSRLPAI